MATTASAFIRLVNAVLTGSTVGAALQARAVKAANVAPLVSAGAAIRLDGVPSADLSTAGFAKNGVACMTLSGTTPVTLDLSDTTGVATSYDGDTSFATVNSLKVYNVGAAAFTMEVGGSNPFNWGYSGTGPKVSVPAGGCLVFHSPAGITVDSTHKTILFTPTSGGSMAVVVGGA